MTTWQKLENLPEGLQDLALTALLEGTAISTDQSNYWYKWSAETITDHMGDHVIIKNSAKKIYFKVY